MRTRFGCITIILALAVSFAASAENDYRRKVSVVGAYGTLFNTEKLLNNFVARNGQMTFSVRYSLATTPESRNADFDEVFNYPEFGFGANIDRYSRMKFKKGSYLSDVLDLYAFMEGHFYKNRYMSAGFMFDFGVSFNNCRYDVERNPEQYLLGAPVSVYAAFGPQLKFRPWSRLELGLSAYWNHHSNGHTWMPNYGLNGLAFEGSVSYCLDEPYTAQVRKLEKTPEYDAGFHLNAYLSFGFHASRTEFIAYNLNVPDPAEKQRHFPSYPRAGVGLEGEFRYSRIFSTGLVLDLNYNWDVPYLPKADAKIYGDDAVRNLRYDPFTAGLGFVHEIHLGNVSAFCGVSYYLYRNMGISENVKLLQRAGMRFRFPRLNNIFLSWCIRSLRFNDADYFEFQLGVPLVRPKERG